MCFYILLLFRLNSSLEKNRFEIVKLTLDKTLFWRTTNSSLYVSNYGCFNFTKFYFKTLTSYIWLRFSFKILLALSKTSNFMKSDDIRMHRIFRDFIKYLTTLIFPLLSFILKMCYFIEWCRLSNANHVTGHINRMKVFAEIWF